MFAHQNTRITHLFAKFCQVRDGRTIWIADAHRGGGKRFVVRADQILTAFLELELAIRAAMKQELRSFSQNV
jgi:hypothetical protein